MAEHTGDGLVALGGGRDFPLMKPLPLDALQDVVEHTGDVLGDGDSTGVGGARKLRIDFCTSLGFTVSV